MCGNSVLQALTTNERDIKPSKLQHTSCNHNQRNIMVNHEYSVYSWRMKRIEEQRTNIGSDTT